ncbi:aggrecan core protein-like [Lingula anatina]|uniref:Aggrecan core protein-like n=1 Tax=Lingula anatina TaxID=7574 RepID=A0A1S3JR47_LINAN|nr:aggrecan core protein-like [Lingula anatina]|eukprot:XP_013412459.1 aggrecan core protein-like [Lingula anatina]
MKKIGFVVMVMWIWVAAVVVCQSSDINYCNICQDNSQLKAAVTEIKEMLKTQDPKCSALVEIIQNQSRILSQQLEAIEAQKQQLEKLKRDPTFCAKAGVFHVKSPDGHYKLTFAEAMEMCSKYGASIATHAQLLAAWGKGLDVCACGWLADGTMGYPIWKPRRGCMSSTGIVARDDLACKTHVDRYNQGKADVFCFKQQ